MANPTTNYSWQMPTSTDLVTDLPADFEVFGQAVDNTMATMIPKSLVDAKGDIIAATAADTVSRLAVGANNTVLTADSSTATGLKWATAAGGAGGTYTSKATSGATYYVRSGNTVNATATPAEDTTYYTPIMVSGITADRIYITTANTFTGTPTVRLGLYSNDATLNIPSTLIVDAGTVSPNTSATSYEITISQTLSAGLYWLAVNLQTLGGGNDNFAACTATSANYSPLGMINNTSAPILLGTGFINGYYQSAVTGAFSNAGTLIRSAAAITIAGLRY